MKVLNYLRKTGRTALCAVFVALASPMWGQVSFGQPEKINDEWKFYLGDVDDGQSVSFDDSKWRQIDLPHDWTVKCQLSPSLASATGYLPGGIAWYRKSISIPEEKKGEKVYLYFEGVYNNSEVFINGKSLGKRPNGYISFTYDATPYIEYGKSNLIAVRVDHSLDADSRWYTGSGIYRDVWLIYANQVHIAQWGVFAYPVSVEKKQAKLNVEVEVENGNDLKASVTVVNTALSKTGKEVSTRVSTLSIPPHTSGKIVAELKIDNPELWDLDNPNLYQIKTSVFNGKEKIDETLTQTGIRKLTFDPNKGLALNGKWIKAKGVCVHHDAGVLGSAVPKEVWKRRLQTLKELGCNAIRTSHNPQAPDFYDICDEIGLLVMDEAFDEWEFPKRKWIEGWNVGKPGFQGNASFFKEWSEKDLADMVRRDRNHISIFAWSIGNEVDYPNDPYSHPILDGDKSFSQPIFGGYKKDAPNAARLGEIAKQLATVVKKFDRSRPVTAALAGVVMSNETEYPFSVDIAGYNYTENLYKSDHEKYPDRVIYGSENGHDIAKWHIVRDNDYIFGQFLWTGLDYLGESGRWPSRGFNTGMVDFAGFAKPRGYFRQSLWAEKPMIYIGTYPSQNRLSTDAQPVWYYEDNQNVRVVCYTNTAKARLELNGKVVGDTKEYDDKTGIIFWDIPFQKGKLEAVGIDKTGNEVCRYNIQTFKQPYAISAKALESVISKDKGVAHVVVQIVDEVGNPVFISDNEVVCRISGPARLLGLEAGNNSDMGDYTDNRQRVFMGRLLAYIQATGEGTVELQFSSPWLKPVEVKLEAK
jgi:beta-galactosidase/beta-glucuronidase